MGAILAFVLSPVGRYLVGAAAIIAALMGAYFYIKGVGYAECKAEWNAAELRAVERGEGARRDAERDTDGGLRGGDQFDRDRGPM